MIDQGVYFLNNTEQFWVNTIPLSITAFIFFAFVSWFSNKFVRKNELFKRYNYIGMFFVDLIGGNIQYMTFRCAQQLFQVVPLGPMYYINISVCYLILFIIVVYSVVSIIIFKAFYTRLSREFIIEELFGSYWQVRLILTNLLKMLSGFTHAYFYHNHLIQSILLLLIWVIKTSFYSVTMSKVNSLL